MSGIEGFSFNTVVGNFDTAANWTAVNGQYDPTPGVVPYSYANIILGSAVKQMNATGNDVVGGLYANGAAAGGGSNMLNVTGSFTGPIDQFSDYTLLVQAGGVASAASATISNSSVLDYGSVTIGNSGIIATGSTITIENHGIFTDSNNISLSGSTLALETGGSLTLTGQLNESGGSRVTLQSGAVMTIGNAINVTGSTFVQDAGSTLQAMDLSVSSGAVVSLGGHDSFTGGGGIIATGSTIVIGASATVIANELSLTSPNTLIVDGVLDLTSNGGEVAGGTNIINAGGVVNMGAGEDQSATDSWTINGGTFVSSNSFEAASFNFTGTGGVLDLSNDSPTNTGVTITGFNQYDGLILNSLTGSGAVTLETVGNGHTLEILQGGTVVSVVDNFTLASGSSLSQIHGTVSNGQYVVNYCFYAGTRLATAEGEIDVEQVVEGMRLKTASGAILPVRWVGRSEISTRFADPLRALPIRIKAGALAENLPARDLLLSPDHALFLGGVLVQAGALVNGTSIIREHDVPECFTYYHVELATHELLLAEGVAAESFVDNVDRMNFHNWDERDAPREPVLELPYPRAKAARQVPGSVRQTLASRAELFANIQAA